MNLGARIRQAREAKGLSQYDLAEQAGISRSYLCEVEAGRSWKVGAEVLRSLTPLLGVSADWLLGLSEMTVTDTNSRIRQLLAENAELRAWKQRAGERARKLAEELEDG